MPGRHSIEVVIPVKSMARHLELCLATLMPQLKPGDRVTVADDGSTDATAAVAAAAGANVLRLPVSRGPYVARNQAAAESGADFLVFVDARCRPNAGWLETHRRLLSEPDVALSCTDVEVQRGKSLASRIAAVQEPFAISTRVGVEGRWDWYPTANLGVRRTAFEAVGGFREIRSGGDEDLCRRIQQAGLGRLAADFGAYMSWEPRDSLRQLTRQWYRYGTGAAMLQTESGPAPTHRGTQLPTTAQTAQRLLVRGLKSPREALPVAGAFAMHVAFTAGKFRARRKAGQPAVHDTATKARES